MESTTRYFGKMPHDVFGSAIWDEPNLCKLYILCTIKALIKDSTFRWGNQRKITVSLKAGQFITGRAALHREFYKNCSSEPKSPITVWRWLNILQELGFININCEQAFSVVTVYNTIGYNHSIAENVQLDVAQGISQGIHEGISQGISDMNNEATHYNRLEVRNQNLEYIYSEKDEFEEIHCKPQDKTPEPEDAFDGLKPEIASTLIDFWSDLVQKNPLRISTIEKQQIFDSYRGCQCDMEMWKDAMESSAGTSPKWRVKIYLDNDGPAKFEKKKADAAYLEKCRLRELENQKCNKIL